VIDDSFSNRRNCLLNPPHVEVFQQFLGFFFRQFAFAPGSRLDTLNLLLNLGADVNRKCELGNTALH
jgi:ankyrin repeat protein